MNTENLSTLKIHKLTKAQYERELAAGNIDPNALYLTPDEGSKAYGAVQYNEVQELTAGQKAQARFNIGAAELNDIYKGPLKEYHYTWDGVTEGRDTFTMTVTVDQSPYKTYHFCKVSNDILERSLARQFNGALIMYNNGDTEYRDPRYDILDRDDGACASGCEEYDNYYMITGSDLISFFHGDSIIFAEAAGPYTCSDDTNDIVVTFTVPSSGVYFPFNPDENKYISDFTLSTFDKREIYLGNATVSVNESNDPLAKFNNDGALETFFEDGRRYRMATTNFVEDYADYLLDTVNLLIDNIPKMVTITQEDYDKLVANGTIDPDMYYVIVSGSA